MFICVKPSLVPAAPSRPRSERTSTERRNSKNDEINDFLEKDRLDFTDLANCRVNLNPGLSDIVSFKTDDDIWNIQSKELVAGVPR